MHQYRIENEHRIYQGFQSLDQAQVFFESKNGQMLGPYPRLKVDRGDAVVVLVHEITRDEVLFVRQFRYPCVKKGQPWLLELVAGMIDDGETPEVAARRETSEEAGFEPGTLVPGPTFFSTPGGCSEYLHGFYCPVTQTNRRGQGGGTDPGEDLELIWIDRRKAIQMAQAGEIHDAKSLVMLLWLPAVIP